MEGGSALHYHTPITHLFGSHTRQDHLINDMCIKMLQHLEKCDTTVTSVLHHFYLQVAL